MKIDLCVINNNSIVDKYNYSVSDFVHNGSKIEVEDKNLILTQLISLTSDWKKTNRKTINNGFYVYVEVGNYHNEYLFEDCLPNNFQIFIREMKNVLED